MKKIKTIVSLGPATNNSAYLKKIKKRDVSFVRINMSHSTISDLKHYIKISKNAELPFIIDTEGSQIRSCDYLESAYTWAEGDILKIYGNNILGSKDAISLRPSKIVPQLRKGDLIKIDFHALILHVINISTIGQGYVTCRVISAGTAGMNKATVIHKGTCRQFNLPVLTKKDHKAIQVGLKENIEYIAVSFVRKADDIRYVRKISNGKMKIISKIECIDALENLDEIIEETDFLLLDRGDLSSEIPIEKLPFTQKIIISRAKKHNKGVFVATNLLETMISHIKPTRAEVNDIINTILDGAEGLILAAETAIGKYPIECINVLNKIITHADMVVEREELLKAKNQYVVKVLEDKDYLLRSFTSGTLVEPNGGKLIQCFIDKKLLSELDLDAIIKIPIDEKIYMDAEQISIGTFSPLTGFMTKKQLISVLNNLRLPDSTPWPMPVTLDVDDDCAKKLKDQEYAALTYNGENVAIIQIKDIYKFDIEKLVLKLYGTSDPKHHGVTVTQKLKPWFLGCKIYLIKRKNSEFKQYELTPMQARLLFEERNWTKIVGFHTRNVIHRSHEFIQMEALKMTGCDGLFVHPVIGKKKQGDFLTKHIINSYEIMQKQFYPANKVIFAAFSTFSRYAGPREALFTALCRQNFGCSHFIVGRDHTGVGKYYAPNASHKIFDCFPDLGIKAVCFDEVIYSEDSNKYVHLSDFQKATEHFLSISGTEARKIFKSGSIPPEWFMRPEISQQIKEGIESGSKVFF